MLADSFRSLVEHAPDAIVVSRDGVVLYANAATARLLGHDDVSEIIGKPMTFLDRRSVEVMRRRIEQMAGSGERLVPREYPARRRDGREITAEIASTIIDFDGGPAVLAYVRDVTERTRLRAQLAQCDRLASLGMMAAGVAHGINNPLAVVALAADSLLRRVPPGERALVADVRGAIERIAAIVRDLRFFGHDDDDQAGPLDLRGAIDSAERLVMHEIAPRGTLVKDYDELPPVTGVRRHVEQVFVNLLLNAANALEDRDGGRIVVSAMVVGERVVVIVEDNGKGTSAAMKALLFEPHSATRAPSGGAGPGLSACRDMLLRDGGDLEVRDGDDGGTAMVVTLPRASVGDLRRQATAAPPAQRASGVSSPSLRVLVVDDEPLIVRSLTILLEPHARVTGVTVAAQALELVLADPAAFDVVVCDIMMPGMTGADIHERVARERPGREACFVFITGGTYTPRTRGYFDRIPNTCLMKPFVTEDLVAAIARVGSAQVATTP